MMENVKGNPGVAKQQGQGQEISPGLKSKIDKWIDNVLILIHTPDSRGQLVNQMQQGGNKPPQAVVAEVANSVFNHIIQSAEGGGEEPSEIVMGTVGVTIVGELIELAEVEGLFQLSQEEQVAALVLAVQEYFYQGVKGNSIDPAVLQRDLEPMMPDDIRQKGLAVAKEKGLRGVSNEQR